MASFSVHVSGSYHDISALICLDPSHKRSAISSTFALAYHVPLTVEPGGNTIANSFGTGPVIVPTLIGQYVCCLSMYTEFLESCDVVFGADWFAIYMLTMHSGCVLDPSPMAFSDATQPVCWISHEDYVSASVWDLLSMTVSFGSANSGPGESSPEQSYPSESTTETDMYNVSMSQWSSNSALIYNPFFADAIDFLLTDVNIYVVDYTYNAFCTYLISELYGKIIHHISFFPNHIGSFVMALPLYDRCPLGIHECYCGVYERTDNNRKGY